jgi:hypothetical protein
VIAIQTSKNFHSDAQIKSVRLFFVGGYSAEIFATRSGRWREVFWTIRPRQPVARPDRLGRKFARQA